MALHFISDLHLDPEQPAISGLFLNYLQGPARQADALYILGDLFEVWADDDVSLPLYEREIGAIRELADSGVPVYFQCGNRDFLCGAQFASAAGLRLIPEPEPVGQALLMHGDVLCTDDLGYQRFRRLVRMRWLQWLYRRLPGPIKLRISEKIRGRSSERTRLKPQDILDVSPQAVTDCMQAHPDVRLLIHGHTHRPADHELGAGRYRLVLSDWSASHGEYLSLNTDGGWQRHAVSA